MGLRKKGSFQLDFWVSPMHGWSKNKCGTAVRNVCLPTIEKAGIWQFGECRRAWQQQHANGRLSEQAFAV